MTPREVKRVELVKQWTVRLDKEMDHYLESPKMAEVLGGPYSLTTELPRVLELTVSIKGKRKLVGTSHKLLKLSNLKESEPPFVMDLFDEDSAEELPLIRLHRDKSSKQASSLGDTNRSFGAKASAQINSHTLFRGVLAMKRVPEPVVILSSQEHASPSQSF